MCTKLTSRSFLWICQHSFFRCCELQEDDADDKENNGSYDDEDGNLSWLKAVGVQDKIKRPDSLTAQLYPLQQLLKSHSIIKLAASKVHFHWHVLNQLVQS